jgi:hypothetical protein
MCSAGEAPGTSLGTPVVKCSNTQNMKEQTTDS